MDFDINIERRMELEVALDHAESRPLLDKRIEAAAYYIRSDGSRDSRRLLYELGLVVSKDGSRREEAMELFVLAAGMGDPDNWLLEFAEIGCAIGGA